MTPAATRQSIQVGKAPHTYPILFASGDSNLTEMILQETAGAHSCVIVVDATVHALYPRLIQKLSTKLGRRTTILTIPSGEQHKSGSHLLKLAGHIIDTGVDRSSMVIAVGGGVTTDLAGCAASLTLRGIRWIAIPTTLLGMVDAAIGAKTGVNTKQGKNLLGTFWSPSAVIVSSDFVRTQRPDEFATGEAEAVKYFALRGRPSLKSLATLLETFPAHDTALANRIIHQCARIKARIVTDDVRESSQRAFLNFGHTIGHALENCSGYRHLSHGRAVAAGMVGALYLSGREGLRATATLENLERYCRRLASGKPVRINPAEALDSLVYDKKRRNGKLMFVLLRGIGKPYLQQAPDKRTLRRAVELSVQALND